MSASPPTRPYAFISYASAERPRALAVAEALEGAGIPTWLDRRSITGGTSWSAEIVQGIEGCAALVLLVSPAAMASPNVAQEVQLAWEGRRPALPLLLAPAEPPPALRYALAGRQWVELLDRPEAAWLPEVLRALAHLGLGAGHPQPAPSAPPLAAPPAPPHNLPAQLTSFVGREREIAAVRALLVEHRLVALTGVGGTGKTRLALAVAERVRADYPEGAWLVELAPLTDPALVPQAVAGVIGVREQPGEPLLTTLVVALAPRRLLLVLDNCEHLIDACARLAEELLRHCPHLCILATSREQLGVPGEVAYRVPSLALPPIVPGSVADLAEIEAVRLFVARAQAAQPRFALTEANAAIVARLCARLDGIPLALELAAARLRALPVEHLAQRLDDRFRLLTGGSRTALPRQQTLQATLDWSYRLLSDEERLLFRRLSVFAGGWTLDAAEAVCADERIETWAVLDLLTGLVDKSLVQVDESGDAARYRLLETMRQYARERLAETDEGAAVRDHHRDWCLALAEEVEPQLTTGAQAEAVARLDAEVDNLRAALAWSQSGEPTPGLRLAVALYRFWFYSARPAEGAEWLTRFLDLAPEPTSHRAQGLGRLGHLLIITTYDLARIEAGFQEAIALSRALNASEPLFFALRHMRYVLFARHGPPGRVALHAEALAMGRELGDRFGEGVLLQTMGFDAYLTGDLPLANRLLDESLSVLREVGDTGQIGLTLSHQAEAAGWAGDYGRVLQIIDVLGIEFKAYAGYFDFVSSWHRAAVTWASGDVTLALSEGERLVSWIERDHPQVRVWFPGSRIVLARVVLAAGDVLRARTLLIEALPRARENLLAEVYYWLGRVEWRAGDLRAALGHLRAALRRQRDRGEWVYAPDMLEAVAGVLLADGANASAVRWLASAATTRVAWGVPRPPIEQPGMDETLAAARSALGDEAFSAAWAAGEALTIQAVTEEALALLDERLGAGPDA